LKDNNSVCAYTSSLLMYTKSGINNKTFIRMYISRVWIRYCGLIPNTDVTLYAYVVRDTLYCGVNFMLKISETIWHAVCNTFKRLLS